jgi:hypothetical protein
VQPGDGLLDPVAVVALVALVGNDHLGKRLAASTSWAGLTGKISDVAGVLLLPLLVLAAVEGWRAWRRRWAGPDPRAALIVAVVVAVAFAAMKTTAAGGAVYAWSLGALQWPVYALIAVAEHAGALPPLRPVRHVVDPTDLVALPGAFYVVRQARCRARSWASNGATNASNAPR